MVQLFCDLRLIIRNKQNGVQIHFGPSLTFGYDVQQTELKDCKCISKLSPRCLQAFSMWSQCWPNFFQASRWSQCCPRVVSKFFSKLSHFFKVVPIFFHQNCQNCSYVMTDKSRGLSHTVLSDQLGRQRRLTLKSQPPIHKMQPIYAADISLPHFLQNLKFFFYSRIWILTRIFV